MNEENKSAEIEKKLEVDVKGKSDEDVLKIYISADRTGAKESGLSIEQGIRTALDEVNYKVNGKKIEIVILDHKGSTPR